MTPPKGIVLGADRYDDADPVNLGVGQEITVRDLVELIVRLTRYDGRHPLGRDQARRPAATRAGYESGPRPVRVHRRHLVRRRPARHDRVVRDLRAGCSARTCRSAPADPDPQGVRPPAKTLPSILLVHERYRQRAGEDAVFDAELALLRRHGRDVRTLVVDNAAIPEGGGIRTKLRVGAATMWSSSAARLVARRLEAAPADIVHIHNTFPLLSPSIHVAARQAGAAVVQTIHNYRPICPAATLFRDGRVCHDCVGQAVAWPAVRHGCYRGSRVQTIPVAGMLAMQRIRRSWDAVHAIVALTDFAAGELIAGGLPADRIHVKGNFVEPFGPPRVGPGDWLPLCGSPRPGEGRRHARRGHRPPARWDRGPHRR